MAIVHLEGHVSRALDLYDKTGLYFSIGRTTPWKDESEPDALEINSELEEVIGYKKIESKYLVKPDNTGEITYKDTKWKIVPRENAIEQGARWVYLNCFLSFNEFSTNVSYRQVAVLSGLQVNTGVLSTKYALLPNEVASRGLIEVIDNRKPVYRSADLRERLSIIVEL